MKFQILISIPLIETPYLARLHFGRLFDKNWRFFPTKRLATLLPGLYKKFGANEHGNSFGRV
jgi:hypothetical protein